MDVIRYLKQYVYPDTLKENNIMLLKYTIPILNDNNISYWLTDGTLLGCHREHDIIEGDDDVDILIMEEDFQKAIELLNKDLPLFMSKLDPLAELATTSLNNKSGDNTYLGKIDFNKTFKENDIIYKLEDGKRYEYEYNDIFPLKEVDFLELKVKIPKNTPKILEKIYGSDYMTPRAHYKGPEYIGKQYQPPEFIQYILPKIRGYFFFAFIILSTIFIYYLYNKNA